MDGRAAGHNDPLAPGPRDQRRRRAAPENGALLQNPLNRTVNPLPSGFIEKLEHVLQRPAFRLVQGPAGQAFRRLVQQNDFSFGVGGNHSIANGAKRDREPFLLGGKRVFRLPAFAGFGEQFFIRFLEQLTRQPQLAARPLGGRSRPHLRPGDAEQKQRKGQTAE